MFLSGPLVRPVSVTAEGSLGVGASYIGQKSDMRRQTSDLRPAVVGMALDCRDGLALAPQKKGVSPRHTESGP